jgi:pyrimidine operon attenuation protein/uracil phosphoribosyltransferase
VVALVDRGRRELPIKIDHVGKNIPTQPGETVILRIGEADSEDGASQGTLEVVVGMQATANDVSMKRGQE